MIFQNPYALNTTAAALVGFAGTLITQAYTGGDGTSPISPYTRAGMVAMGLAFFAGSVIMLVPV